jgi:hypothetical protein
MERFMNQIRLIAKLKQKPRHGVDPQGAIDALKLLKKLSEDVYASFETGGKDVVRASGFKQVEDAVINAYEKVNILEKRNRKLSESFNVTTMRAAQLSKGFDKLGISLGVNTDKLKTYAGELKKVFPAQAAYLKDATGYGREVMRQADQMRNKLGLSAEVTAGFIQNQALLSGAAATNFNNLDEQIATFSENLRGSYEGAFTDIKEGIGNLDAETAAVFGQKGIGNLSGAILNAKKLGIELSKVLSTGTGFLDVEQAIGNEIELQILGAKDLNVAAIQKARLEGDGLALTEELTTYLKANGEEMKRNPYLLQKSAEALGFSNDELLRMYSQLKINGRLEKDAGVVQSENQKDIADVIEYENALRREAGKDNLTILEEELFLANKLSEAEKQSDKFQTEYAKSIDKDETDQVVQVMKLADGLTKQTTTAINLSSKVIEKLNDAEVIKVLLGAGGVISTIDAFITNLKTLATAGPGETITDGTTSKQMNDLFIPAGGKNYVSGPLGSFELNPKDDIIAMPNARSAVASKRGSDTAAIIAALQAMSFHVTNIFDGDKIQSQLTIRQGQRLNA